MGINVLFDIWCLLYDVNSKRLKITSWRRWVISFVVKSIIPLNDIGNYYYLQDSKNLYFIRVW